MHINRRDIIKFSAAASFSAGVSSMSWPAFAKTSPTSLRFGASVASKAAEPMLNFGLYKFADDVREMSDGSLVIDIIDRAQGCAEETCTQRVMTGTFDIGTSSTQNSSGFLPYLQAIDWPMFWNGRTQFTNFLFSSAGKSLYTDAIEKLYGIVPLFFSTVEMRDIIMGLKYADKPEVRTPSQLKGVKIRMTNSVMIKQFFELLECSPVPLPFTELIEGLRSGVVDGTETWPSAGVAFGMASVISQDVSIGFAPGVSMAFISKNRFDGLSGEHKEILREAGYRAMVNSYHGIEKGQTETIGNREPASDESSYSLEGVRNVFLSEDERTVFAEKAGAEMNIEKYGKIRKQLSDLVGWDVFEKLINARNDLAVDELQERKWWK